MDRPRRPPNNPPDNRGKSATIAQHYYPEGGYGHIIVLLAFIVFLITSGLPFVFNQAQYEVIRENLKTFVPRSNFRKSSTSFYSSSYASRTTASPTLNFTLGSPSTTSYVRTTNSSLIPSLSTSSPTWPGRNSSKIDPQLSSFNVSSADPDEVLKGVLIGALSTSMSHLVSPLTVAVCKRKSNRLVAILGGLVTALGCLFTSFATEFHQILLSFGIILAIGISMCREAAIIMVGQYFKRERPRAEMLAMTGHGVGVAIIPYLVKYCTGIKSWRFGFQALAILCSSMFIIGILYRPASLYHPQRRAILHLKSLQKRGKIKPHHRQAMATAMAKTQAGYKGHLNTNIKRPYFEFTILKSRTIQLLLMSTFIISFGQQSVMLIITFLAGTIPHSNEKSTDSDPLQVFLVYGSGQIIGTLVFGLLNIKQSDNCMISRIYLTQGALFATSLSLLAAGLTNGHSIFIALYGFFLGGQWYSLRLYTHEKSRARNFDRAWSFIYFVSFIPIIAGTMGIAWMSIKVNYQAAYYIPAIVSAVGGAVFFLIDAKKSKRRPEVNQRPGVIKNQQAQLSPKTKVPRQVVAIEQFPNDDGKLEWEDNSPRRSRPYSQKELGSDDMPQINIHEPPGGLSLPKMMDIRNYIAEQELSTLRMRHNDRSHLEDDDMDGHIQSDHQISIHSPVRQSETLVPSAHGNQILQTEEDLNAIEAHDLMDHWSFSDDEDVFKSGPVDYEHLGQAEPSINGRSSGSDDESFK